MSLQELSIAVQDKTLAVTSQGLQELELTQRHVTNKGKFILFLCLFGVSCFSCFSLDFLNMSINFQNNITLDGKGLLLLRTG